MERLEASAGKAERESGETSEKVVGKEFGKCVRERECCQMRMLSGETSEKVVGKEFGKCVRERECCQMRMLSGETSEKVVRIACGRETLF